VTVSDKKKVTGRKWPSSRRWRSLMVYCKNSIFFTSEKFSVSSW